MAGPKEDLLRAIEYLNYDAYDAPHHGGFHDWTDALEEIEKVAIEEERAWWVKRYAAACVTSEAGFEGSRQMMRRVNEWGRANPDRMKEPF